MFTDRVNRPFGATNDAARDAAVPGVGASVGASFDAVAGGCCDFGMRPGIIRL